MLDFGQRSMSKQELRDFLNGDIHYAAVATLRRDGWPFNVPLGFWYDGEFLYITVAPDRGGAKRLRRDPRVAVTVFDLAFPPKFASFIGEAEEIPDPDDEISLRIHRRVDYGVSGVDTREYERNWLLPGRVVFRIRILETTTMDLTKVEDLAFDGAMTPQEAQRLRSATGQTLA